ncbi:MAG: hypothetical protein IPK85_22250 [Gemmatimonadetes bacterium]|nr:hypothetical protein [Gemmatimonadota bacterium]
MKVALTFACIAPLMLGAQTAKPPAPRAIATADAKAGEILGAVSQARGLPDGRVLVNDAIGRRVLLFEKDLQKFTVVADTTPATGNAYSGRFGGLIPYRGDSTLFVDPQALTMMVIDPTGKLGRVMSVPRPNEAQALVAGNNGFPGFDGQGRLVYRAPPQLRMGGPGGPGGPGAGGGQRVEVRTEGGAARGPGGMPAGFRMPDFPDSNAVVRVEMATRKLDTLGFVKVPKTKLEMTTDTSGRMMVAPIIHPLPQVDDWAVLADGSVALIRGIDYHIDWTKADGSKEASDRLPFEWRHLNDSAKAAFVDSAQVVMNKMREEAQKQMRDNPGQMPRAMQEGAAMVGAPMITMRFEGRAGGGGPPGADAPRGRNEAGPGAGMNFQMPPLKLVPPNELPDYAPPFNTGAARADMDGNVWVRTSIMVNGGPIYDVIDGSGKLVDRVSLPAGRVIAGFGKGGIVYMGVRETAGVRLEQARRNTTMLP